MLRRSKARPTSRPTSGVYLAPATEKALLSRLSRIEGHVRGVNTMLAEHRDCDDILTQVAAVKSAINEVGLILLEGHLETCVLEALRSGDGVIPVNKFKASLARVLRN